MIKFKPYNSCALFTLSAILAFSWAKAQNTTRWDDYFSYTNVKHIWDINGLIFCSAENGLFSYDPNTQEIMKFSKVNELNDVGVTAFTYSPNLQILMIGYERGEMDFLGPEENHNMLEIPLHQSYTGSKRVNHISTYQNAAVISGEFGLASFSLEDFEFMETTYFVQSGIYFGVNESAILDGVIYAASDQGIYIHPLDEFMANFIDWQQPAGLPITSFENIVSFQGNIVASTNGSVYRFDGNNWASLGFFANLRDISVNSNVLSITQINQVSNYDDSFSLIDNASFSEELNTGTRIGSSTFGGSVKSGLISNLNQIHPDGPYSNNSWAVTPYVGQLWISPGGMDSFNDVLQNADGFSHFNGEMWIHNSSEEMLNAKDVVGVTVNPSDTTEVYVSTWMEHPSWSQSGVHIGLFKFKSGQMVEHYNSENSNLLFRERIAGSSFDEEGNLWISQAFADEDKMFLHKLSPSGNWESILLTTSDKPSAQEPVIYGGYAFVPLPRRGGLKISNMQDVYTITNAVGFGDLPTDEVISAAIDEEGVLWIGTALGIRVLYSPIESLLSGSYETEPIIIEQNGIPEALLTDVQINDIEVDGANRKWVATESGGAYYFSEDGTETIFNFTSQNSPLPSNKVNDIEVDESSGVVYFATDKGVVSYRSDAVDIGDSFGDVYSYPNPVRPGFTGVVTIKGLPNDADVRIVDVVGNLVFQTKAAGGIAQWDTKNFNGKLVASGIYLVLMSNHDASETKQTKIAIVR